MVVEAMGDFMSDDRSHAAIIYRVIGIRIVERRLHDARRENDFIHAAVVVGIHGWRRHSPFGAVHGLADFVQAAREIKFRPTPLIFGVGRAVDLQSRIVAPFVGVADFHRERFELRSGLLARFRPHPGQSLQIIAERGDQVVHHFESAGLGFGWKILLHVHLAEGLLRAGQRLAAEVKVLVDELFGKPGRRGIYQMPAQIGFPVASGSCRQLCVERFEKVRLADIDLLQFRMSSGIEVGFPRKIWSERLQVGHRHFVVGLIRITQVCIFH